MTVSVVDERIFDLTYSPGRKKLHINREPMPSFVHRVVLIQSPA